MIKAKPGTQPMTQNSRIAARKWPLSHDLMLANGQGAPVTFHRSSAYHAGCYGAGSQEAEQIMDYSP